MTTTGGNAGTEPGLQPRSGERFSPFAAGREISDGQPSFMLGVIVGESRSPIPSSSGPAPRGWRPPLACAGPGCRSWCWSRPRGWGRSGATATTGCTCTRRGATPPCPTSGSPRGTPRYPSRDQVVDYLERYAAHFQIAPRFGQRVAEHRAAGRRRLGRRAPGRTARSGRAGVVVATGGQPGAAPAASGRAGDRFGGPILHSCRVPQRRRLAGQAGAGGGHGQLRRRRSPWTCATPSAGTSLAVRSPVNVDPPGLPGAVDRRLGDRAQLAAGRRGSPTLVGRLVTPAVVRVRCAALGLRPLPYGPLSSRSAGTTATAVLDVGDRRRASGSGAIRVAARPASFARGHVQFSDGQQLPFDAVVLATGYRAELGALLKPGLDVLQGQGDDGLPRGQRPRAATGPVFLRLPPDRDRRSARAGHRGQAHRPRHRPVPRRRAQPSAARDTRPVRPPRCRPPRRRKQLPQELAGVRAGVAATCSGVPAAMTSPPPAPPSGPRSMT